MSDDSLDRRVAEIVGWTRASAHDPTGCIEDAIAALEAMAERDWLWSTHRLGGLGYEVVLQRIEIGSKPIMGLDYHSLPLAICKAIVATQEGK